MGRGSNENAYAQLFAEGRLAGIRAEFVAVGDGRGFGGRRDAPGIFWSSKILEYENRCQVFTLLGISHCKRPSPLPYAAMRRCKSISAFGYRTRRRDGKHPHRGRKRWAWEPFGLAFIPWKVEYRASASCLRFQPT